MNANRNEKTARAWSPQEQAILHMHYAHGGAAACLAHLPRRSRCAVWTKAKELGVAYRPQRLTIAGNHRARAPQWSADETAVLIREYARGGTAACLPHLPRRSKAGIWTAAHRLGLKWEDAANLQRNDDE